MHVGPPNHGPPPAPPSLPEGYFYAAPPPRRSQALGLWIAGVVMIVALLAGGLGLLIQHTSQHRDQSSVVAAQIDPSSLPSGWSICGANCEDKAIAPSDLHTGDCVRSSVLASQTAGDVRNYSFDFNSTTGLEKEHLVITVRAAQSAADELMIFRATTAPSEYPCIYSYLGGYVKFGAPNASFAAPSADVLPRAMPVNTALFIRASEPFTLEGSSHVAFIDWVTLVVGRFRSTMAFEGVIPATLGESGWDEATAAIHEDSMIQAAAAALEKVAR